MHLAAEAGDDERVGRLLAEGAEVDPLDYRHNTPLHRAAGVGAAKVVALLLMAGADPTARNTFEGTPLHEVAGGGGKKPAADRIGIIDRLLDDGCPVNAVDSTGRTALWYAAATGTVEPSPQEQTIRYLVLRHLLNRGADPTVAARGNNGRPVDAAAGRHQAARYRRVWAQAVELLTSTDNPR
jgi:ankyrin repeat protein